MRISDWSSDVCSSDLGRAGLRAMAFLDLPTHRLHHRVDGESGPWLTFCNSLGTDLHMWDRQAEALSGKFRVLRYDRRGHRSEEHTSELQSLMRSSYAVFGLKKKNLHEYKLIVNHYTGNNILTD